MGTATGAATGAAIRGAETVAATTAELGIAGGFETGAAATATDAGASF